MSATRQELSVKSSIPSQRSGKKTSSSHPSFRPDIEGLRAVAVTIVVLSHAGSATFSGGYVGVDVFFVISGFLITTLLVNELSRRGTISLAGFYARRAMRLLPASTVVLAATLIGSWLWLPPPRFKSISLDALFSTFYGINWRLAIQGTNYLNADAPPSPLQHLWSLAVEEQFYLVWPLLILLVTWLFGRRHRGGAHAADQFLPRGAMVAALFLIVIASLAASVIVTKNSAPWAYFGAHTRAWELAIGALVAMSAPALANAPKLAAAALTWGGLGAVVLSAVTFGANTEFPGYAAALPVLGTAAIIGGGCARPRGGAVQLLGRWPFQQIGKVSYGWYLWHWPILMIGPAALGHSPTLKLNLALAVGALAITFVSYYVIENPLRTQSWFKARTYRGIGMGATLSASAAALALIIGMYTPATPVGGPAVDTASAVRNASDPTAELETLVALAAKNRKLPNNLAPTLTGAAHNDPVIYDDLCHLGYTETQQTGSCTYGDPTGQKTIYLIGDSHGAHWFPAFDAIAKERGVRFVSLTKSGCGVPSVTVYNNVLKRKYSECVTWRNWVLAKIQRDRPDMVVMSSNFGNEGGLIDAQGNRVPEAGIADDALWVNGWAETINKIKSPKTKLVMMEDTPWPTSSAPDCAASHSLELTKCNRSPKTALLESARRDEIAAAAKSLGVTVIDPAPWFCTDKVCPIVVGNILVYKDFSHITMEYSAMLAPIINKVLPPM